MNKQSWLNIIKKFHTKKILVVGDIMIDKFVWGNVERISPEAPVPVVEIVKETEMAGGCGNVANNIISLGGKVVIVTIVGNDDNGARLKQIMLNSGTDISGLFVDHFRPTTVKTRVIAHSQQMVRIDKESKTQVSPTMFEKIREFIIDSSSAIDAILISDYGKGVITRKMLELCITVAKKNNIPITVDPKIEHFMEYKKVTVLTPNLNEATLGMKLHKKPQNEEELYNLGKNILTKLNSDAVVITRGEKGMTLFQRIKGSNIKVYNIPTRAKEVYDVTGAGDTVIATLTLALASGADMYSGCEIGNYAAGVVVGKVGTATVTPKELESIIKLHSNT